MFPENTKGTTTAVLEDLSGNGTYVNDQLVGRNKRRELQDGDEISILDEARYCFRYPRNRDTNGFRQRYSMQQQLGKGHFASVYLCVEKNTGMRYAVKKFEKRAGPGERSKVEGLQQEIAVLMGVSHPSLLCLKDTFDEEDGVYLVLDLAPEGELFNYIVMKQKLSETETRKVFVQLFQAVKYLVCCISLRLLIPFNILLARTKHRPPRHQTRKHPSLRQRPDRQARRLRSRKNHWRGILHHYSLWHTILRRSRNPPILQSPKIHTRRRRVVAWCRTLHLSLRLPSFLRRALRSCQ